MDIETYTYGGGRCSGELRDLQAGLAATAAMQRRTWCFTIGAAEELFGAEAGPVCLAVLKFFMSLLLLLVIAFGSTAGLCASSMWTGARTEGRQ